MGTDNLNLLIWLTRTWVSLELIANATPRTYGSYSRRAILVALPGLSLQVSLGVRGNAVTVTGPAAPDTLLIAPQK